MADRFPLIANSSANQIQELAASDNLNITSSLIVSSGIVTVSAPVDISKDIIVGAAATIAGVVDLNSTTDSTSSTTGALQIAGGVGIAKNVYIGAGLSIAGTLTYEDVTNVDSVGLITAKSGVNVTGGQLQVGAGFSVGAAGVGTFAGNITVGGEVAAATLDISGNADIDGTMEADAITVNGSTLASVIEGTTVTNATHILVTDNESTNENNLITFVENGTSSTGQVGLEMDGDLTYTPSLGRLTATQLAGTLQTAAQTNITSLGSLTGLTISGDVTFTGDSYNVTWDKSADDLIFGDNAQAKFGTDGDLSIYSNGSDSFFASGTGNIDFRTTNAGSINLRADDKYGIYIQNSGTVGLYYDNSLKYSTTGAGSTSVGISTFQDFSSIGMLKERVEVIANKLSAATNINLDSGNIHYFTTNETGTATPNIRYSSAQSLNNKMLIGESVSVTIIFKPNGAGYYAQLTIDGSAVTEEWNGGSAPGSASSGGYDVYTYSITKTADATFLVLANFSNFA